MYVLYWKNQSRAIELSCFNFMHDSYNNNPLLVITFIKNVDRGGEPEKHLILSYKAIRMVTPTKFNSQQKVDVCDE